MVPGWSVAAHVRSTGLWYGCRVSGALETGKCWCGAVVPASTAGEQGQHCHAHNSRRAMHPKIPDPRAAGVHMTKLDVFGVTEDCLGESRRGR